MKIQQISPNITNLKFQNNKRAKNISKNDFSNQTKLYYALNPAILASINFKGKDDRFSAIVEDFMYINDVVIKLLAQEDESLAKVPQIKSMAKEAAIKGQYYAQNAYNMLEQCRKSNKIMMVLNESQVQYVKKEDSETIIARKDGKIIFVVSFKDGKLEQFTCSSGYGEKDSYCYDKMGNLIEAKEGMPEINSSHTPIKRWFKFKNNNLFSYSTGSIYEINDCERPFKIINAQEEYLFDIDGKPKKICFDKRTHIRDDKPFKTTAKRELRYDDGILKSILKDTKKQGENYSCGEDFEFGENGIRLYRFNIELSENSQKIARIYDYNDDKTSGMVFFDYDQKKKTAKEGFEIENKKVLNKLTECEFSSQGLKYKTCEKVYN